MMAKASKCEMSLPGSVLVAGVVTPSMTPPTIRSGEILL
jgi:hypothetical protein